MFYSRYSNNNLINTWLLLNFRVNRVVTLILTVLLLYSTLPSISIETFRDIFPYFGTYQEGQVTFWMGQVTFWMGQVTFIRSLVPDKWLENQFGETWLPARTVTNIKNTIRLTLFFCKTNENRRYIANVVEI